MKEIVIDINDQRSIIAARQTGREMARSFGFTSADQTRLATAISELTRNALQYAEKGTCTITGTNDSSVMQITVIVEDKGPGIEDIHLAMTDGYSTSKGLGAGLPGTKRLMHDFKIESKPGHTKVMISLRRKK